MTVIPSSELSFVQLPGRRSADPLTGIGTGSSLRVVDLDAAERRQAHVHPHTEEIIYVARGSGEIWVDGRWQRFGAGDVVRVPTGEAHAGFADPGTETRLVCFFPHPDLAGNYEETNREVSRSERPTKETG